MTNYFINTARLISAYWKFMKVDLSWTKLLRDPLLILWKYVFHDLVISYFKLFI